LSDPDDAPLLVEAPDDLVRLADRIAGEPLIALDTEADSLHAFRERVCVVQVSVPGLDAIVDPLRVPDLSPLREVVARRDVEVVFHGGDYDVTVLSRDLGFAFGRVFDSMIAATLLGVEKVGLQALVEAEWGVVLSKKFQTSDWKRRPFSPAQVEYLRGDTRYLLELRERLAARLAQADLSEEAEIEFRRLAGRRGAPRADDADAWRSVRGADRLDARGRAVMARAFAWRDEVASRHDVPRFRVVTNDALVALASAPPADLAALRKVPGTEGAVRAGDGEALLGAVLSGVEDDARGEGPPALERPRLSPEERARRDAARGREERLRAWRTQEARRRQVPNVVVLPNPALLAFVEDPPADVAAIAANPDCGRKRAALYGTAILEALRGTKS
jgi:ribonuclease D